MKGDWVRKRFSFCISKTNISICYELVRLHIGTNQKGVQRDQNSLSIFYFETWATYFEWHFECEEVIYSVTLNIVVVLSLFPVAGRLSTQTHGCSCIKKDILEKNLLFLVSPQSWRKINQEREYEVICLIYVRD